ncbi:hypothetical protein CEJ78_19795, partial [Acinetobacter baumannii]
CDHEGLASNFLISSTKTRTICLLSAGEGLIPLSVAVPIPGGIFSQGTWKVSGQFCFTGGRVECDGEGLLDLEELDSDELPSGDWSRGVAQLMASGNENKNLSLSILTKMMP